MIVRYANGQPVGERDLDMIARAFGFMSSQDMDRICHAADEKRRHRLAVAEGMK